MVVIGRLLFRAHWVGGDLRRFERDGKILWRIMPLRSGRALMSRVTIESPARKHREQGLCDCFVRYDVPMPRRRRDDLRTDESTTSPPLITVETSRKSAIFKLSIDLK
jgi:hypothetical protein